MLLAQLTIQQKITDLKILASNASPLERAFIEYAIEQLETVLKTIEG